MFTKKRIGILTYHRSNNYGAFLQAYSLSKRLEKEIPDCSVSVIDYISDEVYTQYHPSVKGYLKLIGSVHPFGRKLSYLKALLFYLKVIRNKGGGVKDYYFEEARKKLSLSEKLIISDRLKDVANYINRNYDVVVVGSDAVWNWQIRQFPNPYFLGPEIKTKKLSYAASSYGQPFRSSSAKQKQYISLAWGEFQYIGVRDVATEDFVKWVNTGLNPHHNCDPTVFLDVKSLPVDIDIVKKKLRKAGFDFTKKSIGLMANSTVAKFVCNELGEEYQIVSVFNKNDCANINILDLNPFEWAVVFSFFCITITHYFHGNLLSLKNGTPTLIIEEKSSYNQQYCSKIRDFMQRVDLDNNCYYLDEMSKGKLKEKVNCILTDFSLAGKIESGLQKEANNFYSFKEALTKAINEN